MTLWPSVHRARSHGGKPDAITIFCTSRCAALVAERLEQETGIPIYDTAAIAVWKSLCLAGVDPARVRS